MGGGEVREGMGGGGGGVRGERGKRGGRDGVKIITDTECSVRLGEDVIS